MADYRTHVFDMDGVLLDSNAAKSMAFFRAAQPYGEEAARQMVRFHQTAGSISRRARWEHFFEHILEREPREGEVDSVIDTCTIYVLSGAMQAAKVPGIERFLKGLVGVGRVVVTGVTTPETNDILARHGLIDRFDHVYGGPRRKGAILRGLVTTGVIALPAVYYGDTEDDYEAATGAGLDFVFVAGYSEWEEGEGFFADKPVTVIRDFTQIRSGEEPPLPSRRGYVRVRADGRAYINDEWVYLGRTLAGAEVRV